MVFVFLLDVCTGDEHAQLCAQGHKSIVVAFIRWEKTKLPQDSWGRSLTLIHFFFMLVPSFHSRQGRTREDPQGYPEGVRQGHDREGPREASASAWGARFRQFFLGPHRAVLARGGSA